MVVIINQEQLFGRSKRDDHPSNPDPSMCPIQKFSHETGSSSVDVYLSAQSPDSFHTVQSFANGFFGSVNHGAGIGDKSGNCTARTSYGEAIGCAVYVNANVHPVFEGHNDPDNTIFQFGNNLFRYCGGKCYLTPNDYVLDTDAGALSDICLGITHTSSFSITPTHTDASSPTSMSLTLSTQTETANSAVTTSAKTTPLLPLETATQETNTVTVHQKSNQWSALNIIGLSFGLFFFVAGVVGVLVCIALAFVFLKTKKSNNYETEELEGTVINLNSRTNKEDSGL